MNRRVRLWFLIVVVGGLGWWLGNTVSRAARAGWAEAGPMGAVETMNRALIQFPWEVSLDPIDLAAGAGVVLAAGLVWLYVSQGRAERRPGAEHGSARWGRPGDIAALMSKARGRNLLLTRTEGLSLDRVARPEHQRNLNVAVIGASGSGKSRFFIQPNLAQAAASYVVTDPKGELLDVTRDRLVEAGHRVRVLNLVDLDQSAQFNPFVYLRPGHEPEDVELMARNIIANTTDGGASASDPFWPRAERALLSALIGFVAATRPEPEQHLGTVVDLLGQMTAFHADTSATDRMFEAAKTFLDSDPSMPRADLLSFALAMHGIYKQAADKTAASILVTCATRLAPLHIPAVRRLVSADTLELDRVGFEPSAVFLVLSDSDKQWAWLSAMLFTTLFQRSVWLADRQPERRLPVPVQVMMDEFANIGRIPDFEIVAATVRSRNLSYQLVVQNIGQGKALYRDGWAAILGNCDTVLFLGSADPDTREYISRALGKQTITVTDSSQSKGAHGSWSQSTRRQGRELLTPDEVGRLPGDEALLLIRGLPPFRSKKLAPITAAPVRRERKASTR